MSGIDRADRADRGDRLHDVVGLAWPAAMLVLGALVLARSWDTWAASGVLALAAVVPLLLVRSAMSVGVSAWAASSVAILLLLLGGYLVTADAGLTLVQVASDVVPRLLTAPRPYAADADLLVGPVLLTALASVLAALRIHSSHRVVPLVAAATLYAGGTLLSAGAADPHGVVAALLVVLAVGGWVFLDRHDEPHRRRMRVAGPVALLGVALLAGSALVPTSGGYDPRDLVDPPLVDVVATSPLAAVGAWNADGARPLFRVSGDDVPLRLAVLDRYDGQQWTAQPRFAPLGTLADPALPDGAVVRQATTTVRIDDLPGGFVPTPGRPTAVDVRTPEDADLLTDLETGSVFDAATPGSGRAGATTAAGTSLDRALTYTITGTTDAPDDAAIEAASVPSDARVTPYLQLPELPTDLATYALAVTRGASTPYQQAVAIQDQVRRGATLGSEAISGSAIYRLQSFLLGRAGTPGARVGSSEQFASAFAVLARANGLPSRVVVGFRPAATGASPVDADGSREVTGADALAWPEVYFSDVGWVPFSPTPDDETFERRPTPQVDVPPTPLPADPTPSASATPAPQADDAAADAAPAARDTGRPWLLAPLAVLVLVVLLLLGSRLLRRASHRRRAAEGDWAEVLDSLHLTPRRPPAHASATQIAAELDARMAQGGETATLLAERADRSAFGPDGAVASSPADLTVVRRHVRRSVPLWRRWWWWLDPRVFRRSR